MNFTRKSAPADSTSDGCNKKYARDLRQDPNPLFSEPRYVRDAVPKNLRKVVRDNIEKARSSALAAVDAYNRPGPRFRTAQYLVLIIIAWIGAFHAIFYKRGKRPWYRKQSSGTGVRYFKVDGEPKHWDLSECVKQYFGDKHPPERKNLEFLIGLRNKIEHRHLPELDPALYGECQSALLNLEELLVQEFGQKWALE
jgi:hypothetical protein